MQGLRKTNIGSRPGLSALWCERKGYPAEENVGGRRIGSDSFPFSVNYVSQWAPMVIAIVLIVVLLGIGAMFFFLLNPRSHRSTTEDYADTVAAQSSEDYSWGSEGQNEQQADEGQVGAESNGRRAIDVFDAKTRSGVTADSVSYSQLDEPGFSKPYDVRQFVADERYEHDDVTLEITSDGIYANGNKISTSTPVFQKLNRKYGRITAKPSISITVSYDDNALIDNSTHERYTHVY